MKTLSIILALSFFINCYAIAQSVIVNPDGTHSIVIDNGNTSTIVNPDGSHSTAIHNGSTTTIVNPDGTHSTAIHNEGSSIIVNPDGSHSTVIHNGSTSTNNSGDRHSTIDKKASSTDITNSVKTTIEDTVSIAKPPKQKLNKRANRKTKDRMKNKSNHRNQ